MPRQLVAGLDDIFGLKQAASVADGSRPGSLPAPLLLSVLILPWLLAGGTFWLLQVRERDRRYPKLARARRAAKIFRVHTSGEGCDLGVPAVEIESDYSALLEHAPGAALPTTPIAEDDSAVILFTSGTTGRPKGAVASHRGIVGFVESAIAGGVKGMMMAAQRGVQGDPPPPTVSLCTVPLFHMSGLFSAATSISNSQTSRIRERNRSYKPRGE